MGSCNQISETNRSQSTVRAIDKTVDSDPTPSQRTVQCRVASVSSGFSELCTHSQLYILFGGSPWEEGRADGGTQHLYTHTSGARSCDALARFLSMVMSMARRCAGACLHQGESECVTDGAPAAHHPCRMCRVSPSDTAPRTACSAGTIRQPVNRNWIGGITEELSPRTTRRSSYRRAGGCENMLRPEGGPTAAESWEDQQQEEAVHPRCDHSHSIAA
jgi:hypothetical protein